MGKNHGTKMQMPHFSQTLATELRDHRSFAFLTDQLTRILPAEHFAYVHTDPDDQFPFKIQIDFFSKIVLSNLQLFIVIFIFYFLLFFLKIGILCWISFPNFYFFEFWIFFIFFYLLLF